MRIWLDGFRPATIYVMYLLSFSYGGAPPLLSTTPEKSNFLVLSYVCFAVWQSVDMVPVVLVILRYRFEPSVVGARFHYILLAILLPTPPPTVDERGLLMRAVLLAAPF